MDFTKKYLEYYPNNVAKLNSFSHQLKNREKFESYCLGKNEYFYKNNESYGFERNIEKFTHEQRLDREYLWSDFGLWATWQGLGKNVFDFSENLLEMLKDTDVADVDLTLIKLPYEFFYMDISRCKIPFASGVASYIEGVYVSEEVNNEIDQDATHERVISFNFTGDYIKHFKHVNNDLYSHVRGFHSYSLYLDKPYNIFNVGESVVNAKDMFLKVYACEDRSNDTKIALNKIHSEFIERTVRLVVNCLLYLTLKDKDLKNNYPPDLPVHLRAKLEKANTKRRKEVVESEIANGGFTKIKYVGTSIRSTNKFDTITGVISPHWRRGHWRNQRHGEHNSLSKLVWIIPTIVNKEKGEPQKGHVYAVENPM